MSDTVDENAESAAPTSRRIFIAGAAVTAASAIAGGGMSLLFMVPRVSFEPPARFKLRYPEEYDEMSVTFDERHRIYIVRDTDTLYVMGATCTHLGCTTRWDDDTNTVFCPCHGSKFHRDGANIAGPAPKPLPRYAVDTALDGRMVVDTERIVPPDEWPKSILQI